LRKHKLIPIEEMTLSDNLKLLGFEIVNWSHGRKRIMHGDQQMTAGRAGDVWEYLHRLDVYHEDDCPIRQSTTGAVVVCEKCHCVFGVCCGKEVCRDCEEGNR